jgi:hypothetical protein
MALDVGDCDVKNTPVAFARISSLPTRLIWKPVVEGVLA